MIKEVLDQRQAVSTTIALVERTCRGGADRQQRVALCPLVELPVIKKHRYVGPSSAMITHCERVLSVSTDRLAVVLRRELVASDQRPELSKYRISLVQLAAPDEQPRLQQPEMGVVVRRRIQLECPLDHRGRTSPLPQRQQWLGCVPGKHRA